MIAGIESITLKYRRLSRNPRGDSMDMWVVFDHPVDYPDVYVARLMIVAPNMVVPTNLVYTADSLGELREMIPQGYHCMPRFPNDDPSVIEVWL